ncbi:hypothetical protein [Deinococcus aquiradiocola]|uniref:Uncharacterized protein n=1 Tax=Deinococcus aquiradiocola TaxID=393059 RepID=A0A917ULE1_9DEIO|nr:hypothetical protein [Deinococcus aquiradiocola]GGJ65462.1 hypothetical protein GCM10008939_06760 [Deinococcus aquiradiocola]
MTPDETPLAAGMLETELRAGALAQEEELRPGVLEHDPADEGNRWDTVQW